MSSAGPHVLPAARRRFQLAHLILREPGRWTRAKLCERYGVSSRQIDKDLAIVRSVYRVRRTRGGYVIDEEA